MNLGVGERREKRARGEEELATGQVDGVSGKGSQ